MPQDAFTLRRNAQELRALLVGGKINKIVQSGKDDLLFYIYTGKTVLKLVVCTNASYNRICLTSSEPEAPLNAPNFCMLLRKHLLGAEIVDIAQIGFERVIALTLHCVSDFTQADRTLYAEIMGKYSNAILTEKGVILGALKTTSLEENRRRVLFSGVKYVLPAPQEKVSPLDGDLLSALSLYPDAQDKARYLFERIAGLAYSTAQRVADEAGSRTGEELAAFIKEYLFTGETYPCVVYENGAPKDFFAKKAPFGVPFESLQAAQDELYSYNEKKKSFEEKKRRLQSVALALKKKQEKKLAQIGESLRECENGESYRVKGELITANIYRLERGMSECKLQNYYDPEGAVITVALDKTLTPAQNAQKYFKRYAKLKRTVEALTPRKEAEEAALAYTLSVISFLSQAESTDDLAGIEEELVSLGLVKPQQNVRKKKEREDIPFRVFEKDGFTVFAGRNNVQNDKLLRAAAPNDVWLHTQKYHSSHVIVVTEGRKIPDGVLLFAAKICAHYSDGRNSGKIPVDYCERKFVKKPPKARAGFVTYTDYKTVLVSADGDPVQSL